MSLLYWLFCCSGSGEGTIPSSLPQGLCTVAHALSPQAHLAAWLVTSQRIGSIADMATHDFGSGGSASLSLPVAYLAECGLAAAAVQALSGAPAEQVTHT
jgi:hypothetical protein